MVLSILHTNESGKTVVGRWAVEIKDTGVQLRHRLGGTNGAANGAANGAPTEPPTESQPSRHDAPSPVNATFECVSPAMGRKKKEVDNTGNAGL